MSADEEILTGGNVTPVARVGATVRRAAGPWSATVARLLRHLEARGFTGAPRALGWDDQDREIVSYIPGAVPQYPLPAYVWTPEALAGAARLLRGYHDATLDFDPGPDAHWQSTDPDPARHEVICHGDVAPYNMVYVEGAPRALIDFDWAGPGTRVWDLAYAAYRFVPLSYALDETPSGLTDPATRAQRLRAFCATYGDVAPDAVLARVVPRLEWLCATITAQAAAGHRGFQRQLAEGHRAHYERELVALAQHLSALRAAL